MRALDYFDSSYPAIYGSYWPSIRLGLLTQRKYVAVLNNLGNYKDTIRRFEDLGAVDIRSKYSSMFDNKPLMDGQKIGLKKNEIKMSESAASWSQNPAAIRPSLIEIDDDEKAVRAQGKSISRYPSEYRQRLESQGSVLGDLKIDPSNRLILPLKFGSDGLMQNYVPSTRLKGMEDWMEETDVFNNVNRGDEYIGLKVEIQSEPIRLPEMLKVYSFPRGDITSFPSPRNDKILQVLDHYALDGGSLLPVLALDLQPGDRVFDMCAAPGGKAMVALQTLLPGLLVMNDSSKSRTTRIRHVIDQYIPEGLDSVLRNLVITQENACYLDMQEEYNKILVDVPCLNDRHSLLEDDNSFFKTTRVKERMMLPELQSQILMSALRAVRPGGCVVYSTCTLSPLQNDGVIQMTMTKIWEKTTMEFVIVDMSEVVKPFEFMYHLGSNLGLRYGQIVLPNIVNNFGPMYIAKIKRIR